MSRQPGTPTAAADAKRSLLESHEASRAALAQPTPAAQPEPQSVDSGAADRPGKHYEQTQRRVEEMRVWAKESLKSEKRIGADSGAEEA